MIRYASRYAVVTAATAAAVSFFWSLGATGRASSDAAYAAFRADVAKRCTARAKLEFADPIVLVDAHGSQSYGVALIYGRPQNPRGMPQLPGLASVVCIYDKKTKATELSGPLETNFVAH